MPAGRPSKLTAKVQGEICRYIRQGVPQKTAANRAGVSESVFYKWKTRGNKAKSGRYFQFVEALKRANVDAEVSLVLQVRTAAKGDWRAAMAILRQRFPENWRKEAKTTVTVQGPSGDGAVPLKLVGQLSLMTPEQLSALAGNDLDTLGKTEVDEDAA